MCFHPPSAIKGSKFMILWFSKVWPWSSKISKTADFDELRLPCPLPPCPCGVQMNITFFYGVSMANKKNPERQKHSLRRFSNFYDLRNSIEKSHVHLNTTGTRGEGGTEDAIRQNLHFLKFWKTRVKLWRIIKSWVLMLL